ncbi:MAG: NADH-quinone oxidoreductase subunit C [Candidatus Omnitrophica bacterium]|nr:NADH-quinone oxidoreductase subunit C [Candidatus Omnitrophota bacterium]
MTDQDRIKQLLERFPGNSLTAAPDNGVLSVTIRPENIALVCSFLSGTLKYDYLHFLTCIDRTDKLEMRYYLYSYSHQGTLVIKTDIARLNGKISSVSSIWKTAEWHERETSELFGVVFEGHPDPRRLLLDDDMDGHPLLKDFTHKVLVKLPKA